MLTNLKLAIIAIRKEAVPFLADPPIPYDEKYKGIIEYPGFHTTSDFDIAAAYAVGRVAQSYTDEEDGVNYVTDYPVVVSIDMAGYEKQVDYDAAEMVAETLYDQLNYFVDEIKDEDTDEEIADKLRDYAEFMEVNSERQDSPLDYISEEVFSHFNSPIRHVADLPNAAEIVRQYMQTGKVPDNVLMDATAQYRYTQDVSEGRIQDVWYVMPIANAMSNFETGEEEFEDEWPGFDIPFEDDLMGGYNNFSSTLVYSAGSKNQLDLPIELPGRMVEYHGTTYNRLKQIAPELPLPEPPSPPYRG